MKVRLAWRTAAGIAALAALSAILAGQSTSRWTAEAVVKELDSAAGSFHSLTADIEHVKYTAVVKDTSTESGKIYVRRDEKMRIEFKEPDPRTILRTGDSLSIYSPKINRVEEYNLGKNRTLVDQYILLGFGTKGESLKKAYEITVLGEESLDGRKTVVLELTPKSDQVRDQISKIQMWIDESAWVPVQQKFFETGSGDYFLFHYRNVEKNTKLSDVRFKQNWPKDVSRVKPQN